MRFSFAVDALNQENINLKRVIVLLVAVVGLLAATVLSVCLRPPILIERTSRGIEIIRPTPYARSDADIRRAIEIMLKARFETAVLSPEIFLSIRQLALRDSEQRELKSRNIQQAIVLRNISIAKDLIQVDFDRILAVGEVRSALKTKVKVAFETADPNELNPYGLKLAFAESMDQAQTKEVKK